jgi:hypothetical protein
MDWDDAPSFAAPTSLFDRAAAAVASTPQYGGSSAPWPQRATAPVGERAHAVTGGGDDDAMRDELLLHEMASMGDEAVLDADAQDELVMDRMRAAVAAGPGALPAGARTLRALEEVGGGTALARCTDYISAATLCVEQEMRRAARGRGPCTGSALVGLSHTGLPLEPTVAAVRQERQLWRVAGLLLGGFIPAQLQLTGRTPSLATLTAAGAGPGATFLPGASLPADAGAHEARLLGVLSSYSPGFVLVSCVMDWCSVSASDDVEDEVRAAVRYEQDAAVCGNPDAGSVVVEGGKVVFGAPPSQGEPAGGPPADLYAALWKLLRCGLHAQAAELATAAGATLQAALLGIGPSAAGTWADMEEGRWGNAFGPLARGAVAAAAAAAPLGSAEQAVLYAISGSVGLRPLLASPLVRTWEDGVWAAAAASLSAHAHGASEARRQAQAAVVGAARLPQVSAAVVASGGTRTAPVVEADALSALAAVRDAGALGRLDLAQASASRFARLVTGLVRLAAAFAPAPSPPGARRAEEAAEDALARVTRPLLSFLLPGRSSEGGGDFRTLALPPLSVAEERAVSASRPPPSPSPAVAAHWATLFNGGGRGLYGPLAPDALPPTTSPLLPADAPLSRWAAHFAVILRDGSPLSAHPLFLGSGADAEAVASAVDDVIYSYSRDLACRTPRTRHALSVLELARALTGRARAVRALVAYVSSLPYDGPLIMGGYVSPLDLLRRGAGSGSVPPRAVLFAASHLQRASDPRTLEGDILGAALRLSVLSSLTLDRATAADCAAAAHSASVSHAPTGSVAEPLAVVGVALPVGGLPHAALMAGLSLVDFTRVASLQLLTGGSTTGLRPGLHVTHAVCAANALSRLLFTEYLHAGSSQGAEEAAAARSALAALRLVHLGLGPTLPPFLPFDIAIEQANAAAEPGAPPTVVDAASELVSWRSLVDAEEAWGAWQAQLDRSLPLPPQTEHAGAASTLGRSLSVFSAAGASGATREEEVNARRASELHRDVVTSRWGRVGGDASAAMAAAVSQAVTAYHIALSPPPSVLGEEGGVDAGSRGALPSASGADVLLQTDPRVTAVSIEEWSEEGGVGIPPAHVVRASLHALALSRLSALAARTRLWVGTGTGPAALALAATPEPPEVVLAPAGCCPQCGRAWRGPGGGCRLAGAHEAAQAV